MVHLTYHADLTDARIEENARRRLHEGPYYFLRSLRCQFSAGVLTLRGRVPYRQLKALAERIVAHVEGVKEVVNKVEVCDPMLAPNGQAVRNAG